MNDKLLWYTARGSGAVSLVLLSAVVALGLLARARTEWPGWPRFLTVALHRDLSLMALVFLAVHIVTAVVDPFTHLGITPVVIPFGSYYRTVWLGLGTIAFELMLAVILTSLVRHAINATLWRGVHWLSYAMWPLAVIHGIGNGTDAFSRWMLGVTFVCVATVVGCVAWRVFAPGDPLARERRAAAAAASASAPPSPGIWR
jgi:methionine sulfoxide reductase heme-binding subunit